MRPVPQAEKSSTMEDTDSEDQTCDDQDEEIVKHSSYQQVMLDVNRCAGRLEKMRQVYFHRTDDYVSSEDLTRESPSPESIPNHVRDDDDSMNPHDVHSDNQSMTSQDFRSQRDLRKKLAKLIVRLLIKNPQLHYYQGFHDVCLTYMIRLGDEKKAEEKLDGMIKTHFYVYMQPTMNETQEYLALVPVIIGLMDEKVQEFLEKAEVGTIFALSWVITWFSHVIPIEGDVEKIYRFLEDEDSHMILYLSAAMVIHKKDKILNLEPEMSIVHHSLTQLPKKEKFSLETIFSEAKIAFETWPPDYVKKKLEDDRRLRMYKVHNFQLMRRLADRLFEPYWGRIVASHPRAMTIFRTITNQLGPFANTFAATNPRVAILVMVIASAFVFQYDRWSR